MAGQPILQGFYLSFSGESSKSSNPINNLYALSPSGSTLSKEVLDPSQTYQELRGLTFGPDGRLYVCQAYKNASAVLAFGAPGNGSYTRPCDGAFVTPSASSGLLHPYQPAFGSDGNLYVSSQDTNVVTAFFGPGASHPGTAMANSSFLQQQYPAGTFNPGTFVPAAEADSNAPKCTAVPSSQGGLTFKSSGGSSNSVRGIAFDSLGHLYAADEAANRVAVYDAATGDFLGAITESKNHSVQSPVALCFDLSGTILYIGSPGNQRLFQYDASQVQQGNFQANSLVQDSKRLDKVSGIAVDPSGNIYTCSRKTSCVYQWSSGGDLLADFAGPFPDTPEQILAVFSSIEG